MKKGFVIYKIHTLSENYFQRIMHFYKIKFSFHFLFFFLCFLMSMENSIKMLLREIWTWEICCEALNLCWELQFHNDWNRLYSCKSFSHEKLEDRRSNGICSHRAITIELQLVQSGIFFLFFFFSYRQHCKKVVQVFEIILWSDTRMYASICTYIQTCNCWKQGNKRCNKQVIWWERERKKRAISFFFLNSNTCFFSYWYAALYT